MTKRVLSLLLALIMALSLCVPAFAADEPEVSADEPATAAADEPVEVAVDEPEAIDYADKGVLEAAVAEAEGMKPDVDAGYYQQVTGDYSTAIKAFYDALKKGQDILAQITDQASYDVWKLTHTDKEIGDAANEIIDAIEGIQNTIWSTQRAALEEWKGFDERTKADNKTLGTQYDFQPDYITDVVDPDLALIEAALKSGLLKDYQAAKKSHDALLLIHSSQSYPTYNDYLTLRDTIATAQAKLDSDDWFDNGHVTGWLEATSLTDYFAKIAENWYDADTLNGFHSWVRLHDVNAAIIGIKAALSENKHTLKMTSAYVEGDYRSILINFTGLDKTKDHHKYDLRVTVNGVAKTIETIDAQTVGTIAARRILAKTWNETKERFVEGDKIDIALYCNDNGKELVQALDTIVIDESYNGPQIADVKYAPDSITVTLTKSMTAANTPVSGYSAENLYYGQAKVTITFDGKTVDSWTIDKDSTQTAWGRDIDPAIGTYTVTLEVTEGQVSGAQDKTFTRSTSTVEVPDITAYKGDTPAEDDPYGAGTKGYDNLLKLIAFAEEHLDGLIAKSGKTEDLMVHLNHRLEGAKEIVAAASTTVYSKDNMKVVDAAVTFLRDALDNFVLAVDASELKASLATAAALVESDYIAENWAAFEKVVAEAEALMAKQPQPDIGTNQKNVDAMVEKLDAAIAELANHIVVPYAERATLKALLDSVPARLAADDFSAESKKAVNDAAAAAQPLLTKTGVKKSDVNAAIKALEDALNNLTTVKSDAVPAAPEGGTGWVTAENGDYYYYKDGKLVQGDWVKSKGLWYHMGATGKMDTGFIHIVDNWGDAYYYLNPSNTKGTMGRMFTGWKMINDSSAGAWGWFETRNNGHQGQCTYTTNWGDFKNYKPVEK